MRLLTKIYNAFRIRWWKKRRQYMDLADYLYNKSFGKHINWQAPEDLNQWINWLEFKSDTTDWSLLADKYKVREYIIAKGYSDNLVPLLATWDNPNIINFENLPQEFVLKINNGSGDVRIVKDKSKIDVNEVKTYFNRLFKKPFGEDTAEPHYLKIKPLIIVEQLLDVNKQTVKSSSLIDYKLWCFNGVPYCFFVCSNRTKEHFNIDLYSAKDWKRIEEGNLIYNNIHRKNQIPIIKPAGFSEMLKIASVLSYGYAQMRVDFYEVDGWIYIGELTLSSACGRMDYFTEKFLIKMGALCRDAVENIRIEELDLR